MRVRMIRRQLLLTALLLATVALAPGAARAQAQMAALTPRDAAIAGTLTKVIEGEIAHTQIALERATDPDVRAFAGRMLREQSIADDRLRRVLSQMSLQDVARSVASSIEENAAQTAERLRTAPAGVFDRIWLDVQIDRHEWLLRTIDETLLPAARTDMVRAQLRMIRTSVSDHLQRARRIRHRFDG